MGKGIFYLVKDLEKWGVFTQINILDNELLTIADEKHNDGIYEFVYEDSYNDINYKIYCGIVDNIELDDESEEVFNGYDIWANEVDIIKDGKVEKHNINLQL